MSVDIFVFLRPGSVPSTEVWQRGLDDAETGVVLDELCDPSTHSGFWPALVDGRQAGFEYDLGPVGNDFDGLDLDLGDRSLVAQFTTHSDLMELKSSMLAAAVLARLTDGVVLDEDTGGIMPHERLLEEGRSLQE